MLHFWLLTHPRELSRLNNTGKIVLDTLDRTESPVLKNITATLVNWDRVAPCERLLNALITQPSVLLYPDLASKKRNCVVENKHKDTLINLQNTQLNVVILDGTWQEARKMYNKSAYLKELSKLYLQTNTTSKYQLRRNQQEFGLCTAEAVIELLKLGSHSQLATSIENSFIAFLGQQKK